MLVFFVAEFCFYFCVFHFVVQQKNYQQVWKYCWKNTKFGTIESNKKEKTTKLPQCREYSQTTILNTQPPNTPTLPTLPTPDPSPHPQAVRGDRWRWDEPPPNGREGSTPTGEGGGGEPPAEGEEVSRRQREARANHYQMEGGWYHH